MSARRQRLLTSRGEPGASEDQLQAEQDNLVSVLVSTDDLAGTVIPGVESRVPDADDWVMRLVNAVERFLTEGYGGWLGYIMGLTESQRMSLRRTNERIETGLVILGRDVPRIHIIGS